MGVYMMSESEMNSFESISPYVRLAHDYITEVNKQLGPIYCADHALHYFKSGAGHYIVEGTRYEIKPGMLFIIRPGVFFSFSANQGTYLHMLNIHFDVIQSNDSKLIKEPYPQSNTSPRSPEPFQLPYEGELVGGLPHLIKLVDPMKYEQLFYKVLQWFHQTGAISLLKSKSVLLDLLSLLWREAEQMSDYNPQLEDNLQEVIRYVNTHLHEPLSLAKLAGIACMSPSYFFKRFKRRFSLSPMKYILRLRIERAKLELTFSEKPIKTIALESGFEGVHPFYHAFKREVGLSPGLYRAANYL
jgi:AraC-like DNA-binding protein